MFQKAIKHESKLRMSIAGPSGSGKTYTALTFASVLNRGGGVAVVDTEHGSASKYADLFDFDVAEMSNFHPSNYVKAIKAAAAAGYDVVILDSITHAWNGRGGILDIVGGNFSKWKEANAVERDFIEAIIANPIHIIATMRAKTQYEVEQNERGKAQPKKVGMGAIQREGIEYEFDIACMMDVQNTITVEKTRCSALTGVVVNRPDAEFMHPVIAWLSGGTPPQRQPADITTTTQAADLHPQDTGTAPETDGKFNKLRKRFHALGTELYGDGWDEKRSGLVDFVTKGEKTSSKELTPAQMQILVEGMEKRRNAAETQAVAA